MGELYKLLRALDKNTVRAFRAHAMVRSRMERQQELGGALNGNDIVQVEDFLNEAVKSDWVLALSRIWFDDRDDSIPKLLKSDEWADAVKSHSAREQLISSQDRIHQWTNDQGKRLELLKFARVEGLAHEIEKSEKRTNTGREDNATLGLLAELTNETSEIVYSIYGILFPLSVDVGDVERKFSRAADRFYDHLCNFKP